MSAGPLTRKQLLYVTEFMSTFSRRLATEKAGYSEVSCPHDLPHVKAAITKLMSKAVENPEPEDITKDSIIREALDIVKTAKKASNPAPAVAALRLIATLKGWTAAKDEDPQGGLDPNMFGGSGEPKNSE